PRLAAHRPRPSFPTRRSSDLAATADRESRFVPDSPATAADRSSRWSSRKPVSVCPEAKAEWVRIETRNERFVTTPWIVAASSARSEEHTSELQSRENLVCRLL